MAEPTHIYQGSMNLAVAHVMKGRVAMWLQLTTALLVLG
jgi:hypothetical protein